MIIKHHCHQYCRFLNIVNFCFFSFFPDHPITYVYNTLHYYHKILSQRAGLKRRLVHSVMRKYKYKQICPWNIRSLIQILYNKLNRIDFLVCLIMKRKFKQWWSTKQTINSLNIQKDHNIWHWKSRSLLGTYIYTHLYSYIYIYVLIIKIHLKVPHSLSHPPSIL